MMEQRIERALDRRQDQDISDRIMRIRGQQVILGTDLAFLYGVRTKVLMQAVRRNVERFPSDFMFRLTWVESASLVRPPESLSSSIRSRPVTLKTHARYRPYVFTEEGVAMVSAVLRNETAVQISIAIIRAFVKLRRAVLAHRDLGRRIEKVEGRLHIAETDIRLLRADVRSIEEVPERPRRVRGFRPEGDSEER
jgi:hypothetical protein